jgi:hypothetical protein
LGSYCSKSLAGRIKAVAGFYVILLTAV